MAFGAGVKRDPALGARFGWCGLVAAALLTVPGCERGARAAPSPPGAGGVARGARVVIERTAGDFIEARVLGHQGSRLKVAASAGGETLEVNAAEAYRVGEAGRALGVGDVAVCNVEGSAWLACRVVARVDAQVEVEDLGMRRFTLPRNRLLDPNDLTAMNVRRRFQRSEVRRAFEHGLERAGPPRAPEGWRVVAGQPVLGLRERAWYSAHVREVDDDAVFVQWATGGRQVELTRDQVIPDPPYDFQPRRGQYGLVRPAAPSSPWFAVRVVSVIAEDTVRTTDAGGEKRDLSLRDLVPLD